MYVRMCTHVCMDVLCMYVMYAHLLEGIHSNKSDFIDFDRKIWPRTSAQSLSECFVYSRTSMLDTFAYIHARYIRVHGCLIHSLTSMLPTSIYTRASFLHLSASTHTYTSIWVTLQVFFFFLFMPTRVLSSIKIHAHVQAIKCTCKSKR